MGVGYPEDLLVSVALGADMFDCVWPTRTAVRPALAPFLLDRLTLGLTAPALRQRHNLNGYPESPPRIFRQRLHHHRNRLLLSMLPARRRRRARHHACLYPSHCFQGDGRCSFVRATYAFWTAFFFFTEQHVGRQLT